MTSCEYAFDPDRVDGETFLDERWECSHEAHEDADRCPFHLGTDARERLGVDDDAVREAMLERLRSRSRADKRFVGATFGELDLTYLVLEGATRYPIDLRHAEVERLACRHSEVEHRLDLRGATLGEVDLADAWLEDGLRARGASVEGELDAFEMESSGDVTFADATFREPASFDEADFDDDVDFSGATFRAPVDFRGAEFHGGSTCSPTTPASRGRPSRPRPASARRRSGSPTSGRRASRQSPTSRRRRSTAT